MNQFSMIFSELGYKLYPTKHKKDIHRLNEDRNRNSEKWKKHHDRTQRGNSETSEV
jgi:hypothetical protein